MPVDKSRFEAKMKLARQAFDTNGPKLLEDAGSYLTAKLVQEILNGASGTDYPKPYPSGISEGASGFVGVITSNLRRSIGAEKVSQFEIRVQQINETLAPYHDEMINWSAQKYGKNFYEIAVQLYGPAIAKEIIAFAARIMKEADNLKKFSYKNPFPG